MPPSKLDAVYRSLLLGKFFIKGWGKPENLQRLFEFRKIISNRATCFKLIPKDYPVEITREETTSDCKIIEGKFMTPLELFLPGLVPEACKDAHFQMILPNTWKNEDYKPVCVHLAGTGDHYYWRRRNLIVKPLLKEAGLGGIILENPFYGMRKPSDQKASALHNVSDIFVMGGCLILESLVLFNWCEKMGLGPFGITGLSMGGHMASLAATNYPKPLVLVPCLSWSTASSVFTEGVMSQSINWDVLETQYYSDGQYREKLSKMVTIVDDSFVAGKQFIQNFHQSMKELKQDIKDANNLTTTPIEPEKVNLSVVNETNPDMDTKKFLEINGKSNKLNLSKELLNKLLSSERCELTVAEINELNEKIIVAICKMKDDKLHDEKRIVAESASLTVNDKNSAPAKATNDAIQSDTSSSDGTTIITSAICERTQNVQIGNCFSKPINVVSSIVQGSCLGPVLFALFINDIHDILNEVKFVIFADDLKIYKTIRSLEDAAVLQANLDRFGKYVEDNKMMLNVKKCNVMSFTRNTTNFIYHPYTINTTILERQDAMRDLGIIYDSKMNFNKQVSSCCAKAKQMLGFVMRAGRNFTEAKTFITLYHTLVRPRIEYATVIWNPHTANQINQLDSVQRKFIKFVVTKCFKVPKDSDNFDYEIWRERLNLEPLSHRRIFNDVKLVTSAFTGKTDSQTFLHSFNLTVPRQSARSYPTFTPIPSNTDTGKFSVGNRLMDNFNNFCGDINLLTTPISNYKLKSIINRKIQHD